MYQSRLLSRHEENTGFLVIISKPGYSSFVKRLAIDSTAWRMCDAQNRLQPTLWTICTVDSVCAADPLWVLRHNGHGWGIAGF